jgi:histidinol-phosphate phosphatase family protein
MPASRRRVKALLLAGGLGRRLQPLTNDSPKCLVSIANRPLLDFWVDCLFEAGIEEARINTHALAEQVRSYISHVNGGGLIQLVESYEPTLLGSAGTVAANADLAANADQIVIIYADNLSDVDLRPLIAFHCIHNDPFTMTLFRAPNPQACGIAELDTQGRVVSFVEKPDHPVSNLANAGIYIVNADAYREIADLRAFDLGFDVLPRFIGRMRGWVWGGYHRDIGNHESLKLAREDMAQFFPTSRFARRLQPHPAVFLDRDGTVIAHVHYLSNPAQVRLLPGAAKAIARLHRAGYSCVVVTNQSAIGRGIITEARLHEIHAEMNRQLAEQGAALDAIYYCPEVPRSDDRTIVEIPSRKPGPGMLRQAAVDLGLELANSWMIGDLISDVIAGLNAGCRSILLTPDPSECPQCNVPLAVGPYLTAPNLAAAANLILAPSGTDG